MTVPQIQLDEIFAFVEKADWKAVHDHSLTLWQKNPTDLKLTLLLGAALIKTGDDKVAVALLSSAADQSPIIRIAQYNQSLPKALQLCSHIADLEIRRYFTQLQTDCLAEHDDTGRITTAVWPQTHNGKTEFNADPMLPHPFMFYAPDLPNIHIFETTSLNWAAELKTHYKTIKADFLTLTESHQAASAPYIHAQSRLGSEWDSLKGQDTWNSFHLYKDGALQDAGRRCENTLKALENVPVVKKNSNPMEAFFSVLKPHTIIPRHYGLANCRATVHFPLIIPKTETPENDCAIRVGHTIHAWNEGETLIFDDSFDHSAWNKTPDTRVVLIFEAWRPDMTDGEINAVKVSYKTRQDWLESRNSLIEALYKAT